METFLSTTRQFLIDQGVGRVGDPLRHQTWRNRGAARLSAGAPRRPARHSRQDQRAHCRCRGISPHNGGREPAMGKPETALRFKIEHCVRQVFSTTFDYGNLQRPSAAASAPSPPVPDTRWSHARWVGGFGLRTRGRNRRAWRHRYGGNRGDRFGDSAPDSTSASSQDADPGPQPGVGVRGEGAKFRTAATSVQPFRPGRRRLRWLRTHRAPVPTGGCRRPGPAAHPRRRTPGASTSPDVAAAVAAAVHPQTRSSAIQTPTLSYDPAENLPS